MLLSLKWLREYVDIPRSMTAEDLVRKLTMHTVEIDGVESQGDKYHGVVIGKVLSVEQHRNADRLRVCEVDLGAEIKKIVCGAPNVEAGQMVPVATIGTILPNKLEIKATNLRGVDSDGMICAEDELGLGDNHSGIMVLPSAKKIGQAFSEYLQADDQIIEVDNKSITNRPDLWGHYGVAREISAFLGVKFKPLEQAKIKKDKKSNKLEISNTEQALCQRYLSLSFSGIKISESPDWIKNRLLAVGMRPINNVVDATNFVMLELGQPMHAFDRKKVDKIVIRKAKKAEKIETLDRKIRTLDQDTLVIADSKKPIAIAGIMGGVETEISEDTDSIILEVANFDAIAIRKSSQRLAIRTDSSMRFEKSLDPKLCELAMSRFVELMQETCKDILSTSDLIDLKNYQANEISIDIDIDWLLDRIGISISEKRIIEILESLGFKIKIIKSEEKKIKKISVIVPSWRSGNDVSIREDVLEEVARIFGYENIIPILPSVTMGRVFQDEKLSFERELKQILSFEQSLVEVYNHSFVSDAQLSKLGVDTDKYLRLLNPVSSQYSLLRQSLIPNMLENIKANQRQVDVVKIYEIGNVFFDLPGEINQGLDNVKLPYQEKRVAIVLAMNSEATLLSDLKSVVEGLLARICGLEIFVNYNEAEILPNWANKNTSALVVPETEKETSVGYISLLDNNLLSANGVKKFVAIAELNLTSLLHLAQSYRIRKYLENSKYPPVIRDLAFITDEKIRFANIRKEILSFPMVKSADLFDVYAGGKLDPGKKSLAFHLLYQESDRTLVSEEVDLVQAEIIKSLKDKFDVQIRDF